MKSKIKKASLILIMFALIVICISGFSYAKYTYNSTWNKYLISKDFYIDSEKLGQIPINNVDYLWDGSSVNFDVKNYENEDSVTGYDILYDASCSIIGDAANHTTCYLNGTSSSTISGTLKSSQSCINNTNDGVNVDEYDKSICEATGYVWQNSKSINNLYFDVVLTDQNYIINNVEVNIIVSSYLPYSKTLSGTFLLHKAEYEGNDVVPVYDNYDNYDRLNIYNPSDLNKCVEISWDSSKLKIKKDSFVSYQLDANNYINNIKISIQSKKSLNYIFYKDDLDNMYTLDEFTIINSTGC